MFPTVERNVQLSCHTCHSTFNKMQVICEHCGEILNDGKRPVLHDISEMIYHRRFVENIPVISL